MGVKQKLEHPNQKLSYGDCKSKSGYRDKDYTADPVINEESPVHTLSLSGSVYTQTTP